MKPILFRGIVSFRFGYAEQRPYPWRWTTPIVLCAFLLICPFLAAINVPLSAYNIVQEATYRPNDSLPSLPLSNILPSILQNPGDFAPQLLAVGDVLFLNNSIFNYTISEAFDSPNLATPISSFPYYNNPLSDNCDVTNITLNLVVTNTMMKNQWESQAQLSGSIICRIPTPFYLTWSGFLPQNVNSETPVAVDDMRFFPYLVMEDLENMFTKWTGPVLISDDSQVDVDFTVHPCCDCAAVLAGSALETTSLLQPPCSSNPVQFIAIDGPEYPISFPTDDGMTAFSVYLPINIPDLLQEGKFSNITQDIEDFSATFQNLFQAVYHLVRLDLGIILDNQLYNSTQMFNRSIAGINRISVFSGGWAADIARGATLNASIMPQWQKEVEFFNTSHIPGMEYLCSIPRIKPLGSAITSVFVSTFAMLSVLWTIFSVIAGALAAACNAPTHRTGHDGCTTKELENGKAIMEEMNTSEGSPLAHDMECVPAWHVPLERMNS
ncbi:hypothetical protein K438DRAFT_1945341 [Mycena galopus ATCC 62051]|nr:hypothetical protein K438DRAFT_1945341 [Mycena galopus ATCC 62051]